MVTDSDKRIKSGWHRIARMPPVCLGVITFVIMFASISLCIGGLAFHFHRIHQNTYHEHLTTLARYAISLVDPVGHQQLVMNPEQQALHQQLLTPLVQLHTQLPEVAYLYTMVLSQNRMYFVLDTSDSPEISAGTAYSVMEEYTDYTASPRWTDDLKQGRIHIDAEPVTDAFGSWVTVSVPFTGQEGTLLFWLGMDIDAADYLSNDQVIRQNMIIILILGAVLSLGVSVMTGVGHRNIQRLQRAQRLQALTDPLTGAWNRRYLKKQAPDIWLSFRTDNKPCAVLVMDIDHFKQINDTRGHDAGDQCLIQLVRTLNQSLRGEDHLIRMGGEEFLMIFPRLHDHMALYRAAERLRELIASLTIELNEGETLSFTVSMGVAISQRQDKSLEGTIRRADHCLYQAKAGGRNRVIVSDRSPG